MTKANFQQEVNKEEYELRKIENKRRLYLRDIQPYINLKTKIYAVSMPEYRVYKDRVETVYKFTSEQKEILDNLDAMIDRVFQSYMNHPPNRGI